MKKIHFAIVLIVYMFLFFSVPSYASEKTIEDYKAIDVEKQMRATIQEMMVDSQNPLKDYDTSSRAEKMFKTIVSNQWIITRSMLYGLDNLSGAVAVLRDPSAAMASAKQTAADAAAAAVGAAGGGSTGAALVGNMAGLSFESRLLLLEILYSSLADNLSDLLSGGSFNPGESVFVRTSVIGALILILMFFVRLAHYGYKLTIGTYRPDEPNEIVLSFVTFVFYLACIIFLRAGVTGLLMLSDIVRNAILGVNNDEIGDFVEGLNKISQAKGIMVGMSTDFTFWEFLTHGLSESLASLTAWIAYLVVGAIIYVIIILGDVMTGITVAIAPICIAVSLIPGFEQFRTLCLQGIIKFSLYIPLASIYALTISLVSMIAPTMGITQYLVISLAFMLGALRIPDMSENLSGAVLQGALMTMGMAVATAPLRLAKMALKVGRFVK